MPERQLLAAAAHAHLPADPAAIQEHLPGRHDQSSHARKGRGTSSAGATSTAGGKPSAPRRPASGGSSGSGTRAAGPAPAKDTKTPAKQTTAPARDKKWLNDHYGEWRDSLSPAQDRALGFYQSPGFALMNGQLRGLDKADIKASVSFNDADLARAAKASKDLKAAIRKAPPLTEAMTVYRGFSADQFGDLKAGQMVSDRGFVSTSITPDVGSVGQVARQATAEITLPVGTKAAAGSTREMILPPGSKFRVLDVSDRNGTPHVRMEMIL
ncbi:ADP-ribosyltransferase [Sphaerisporangium aureirubrum]|uniref:ADP-ribosyltransferase n=1 Tax=Sphaerisporangium aureirubrum TaxID=1544736 RepID=A0ABW1NDF1_9ACTN